MVMMMMMMNELSLRPYCNVYKNVGAFAKAVIAGDCDDDEPGRDEEDLEQHSTAPSA